MSSLSNKQFSERIDQAKHIRLSPRDAAEARRLLQLLLADDGDSDGSWRGDLELSNARLSLADDANYADAARAILIARQTRRAIFASSMFSEPAWDMLLALYVAEAEQVRLTVTRLAEQSAAPLTTAIRWLEYLEQARLVERREHPTDRRIIFIELSPDGRAKLRTYFRAVIDAGHVRG